MMTVADATLYQRHRMQRDRESAWSLQSFWLPALLFGSIGAITWAIRGTTGWGGIDGTLVPGLTWALLWYYLCRRNGIDARGIVLWLGLGIAVGGELGYGQYTGWIRGNFNVREGVIPIAPAIGYLWFAICGIGWGAPGGIVLGWALNSHVSIRTWVIRATLFAALLVVIFNLGASMLGAGVVESLGASIAHHCPGLIFPKADMVIYGAELDKHLGRTVYTNTQNFLVLIWWVVAMIAASLQRDRPTLVSGTVIGGGFGVAFPLSAVWCLGYAYAPDYIDWWKMWELNTGFFLGVLYVIVLNWAVRDVDADHAPDGSRTASPPKRSVGEPFITAFLGLSGFVLIFGAGYEYFFWTGLLVAAFYVVTICLAHWPASELNADLISQRRRSLLLVYSAFFLVFMLLHGVSSTLGVVLGFYGHEAVDQYEWPPGRVWLMIPATAMLLIATIISIKKMLYQPRDESNLDGSATRLPARMVDLFTGIGIVGAVSIWPSKIAVLYAVFLCIVLFAFNRINIRLDTIDRQTISH